MRETSMAKVVLITGANKGIGFEVARQLGRSGFTVLLGARDASRGEAAAAKLRAEGSDVRPVIADLGRAHEPLPALAPARSDKPPRQSLAQKPQMFALSSQTLVVPTRRPPHSLER